MHARAGEVSGKITLLSRSSDSAPWAPAATNEGAIVYITGFDEPPASGKSIPTLGQKGKAFQPRSLAVTAGDTVNFRNDDEVYHNVWSLSKPKSFDLGSYKMGEERKITFEKPGLVKVFCNIHPEMISSILVLKNNKYVTTDKDGKYRLQGLKPGNLQVRVWVEGAEPVSKEIKITKDSKAVENFEINVTPPSVEHLNKLGKPYPKY